jgi:hypothetical protein
MIEQDTRGTENELTELTVNCPHCGQELAVNLAPVDNKWVCFKCQQAFVVPGTPSESTLPPKIPSAEGGSAPPPELPLPKPPAAPPPVLQEQGSSFGVGTQVIAGLRAGLAPRSARISERCQDRCLVTCPSGYQAHVDEPYLQPLAVVPGAAVLYLDPARRAYLPGTAHRVQGDAVGVELLGGKLAWLPKEIVFPETIDAGASVLQANAQGEMIEAGVVASRGNFGIIIRCPDGFERPWVDDEFGRAIGIAPNSVAPKAPDQVPNLLQLPRVQTAVLLRAGISLLFFLSFMFAGGGGAACVGMFVMVPLLIGVQKLIARFATPLVGHESIQGLQMGSMVGLVILLNLLFQSGGWRLGGALLFGLAMLGCYAWGGPSPPRKYAPPSQKPPSMFDAARQYRIGERVMCWPAGEDFRFIGHVRAQDNTTVQIVLPGGEELRLPRRRVYEYEIALPQRVMARDPKLDVYRPGVIIHNEDQSFTARFDSGEVNQCPLGEIWLPMRKGMESLKEFSEAQLEQVFREVENTLAQARTAAQLGQFANAHKMLTLAIGKYPDWPNLHLAQAFTYQLEKNTPMEAAEAKVEIGALSSDAAAYTVYGNACLKLNRIVEAEEAFRAALNLNPFEPGHWQNLGNALKSQAKHAEAASCFAQAKRRGAPG